MENPMERKIIETSFFVIDMVRRSWVERFFSWPWRPWVKSNPVKTPSMVKIGNDIYCHPDLLTTAQHMLANCKGGDECGNCKWTWDSATSNGQCEFCEGRQWFDEDIE
ncbi:MAG: hypothetical protein HZB50_03075 [Chloroflexi bacterium]|nr:hypothetical protein [Chloroflexota bacterium]